MAEAFLAGQAAFPGLAFRGNGRTWIARNEGKIVFNDNNSLAGPGA
jgi:hypothetical protein